MRRQGCPEQDSGQRDETLEPPSELHLRSMSCLLLDIHGVLYLFYQALLPISILQRSMFLFFSCCCGKG